MSSRADKIRKWLRRSFPRLYKRYGRYFHTHYRLTRRILGHARRHPGQYADPELKEALAALAGGDVSVFLFAGREKYDAPEVPVHVDDGGYPWVEHSGRRLYFRRGTPAENVRDNYRRLLMEQDPASPHRYRAEGFETAEGDVILDIGSAEGIFALEGVEKAARVILFEVDDEWIGALERTFAPWSSKVAIINRFASDVDGAGEVTVDTVVRGLDPVLCGLDPGAPLLLKMDVEGAEERVLRGAREALSRPDTRAVVCTYHRHGDCEKLSGIMRGLGYDVSASPGYMLFVHDKNQSQPFFRRGVIYCSKK